MHDPSAVRGTRSIPASTLFPRVRDPSMGGLGRAQLNVSDKAVDAEEKPEFRHFRRVAGSASADLHPGCST